MKKILATLLALAMVLTILPLAVSAAELSAEIDSVTGSATGVAYDGTNGAYALTSPNFVVKSGNSPLSYSTLIMNKPLLFSNKACTSAYKLTTTPIPGTTYYTNVLIDLWEKDAYDLTYDHDDIIANFSFTIPGYDVEYYSLAEREMGSFLDITLTVTPKMPEIKDVKLTADGLVFDSSLDSYVPNITSTSIKDADGNTLTIDPVWHSGMYTSGSFVAANQMDDELEPGVTYYASVCVDLYKDGVYQYDYVGYNAIQDNFSLTIPGYKVEFYDFMEREMGSYMDIKYTIVRDKVEIGTVTGTATGVAHDGTLGGYALTNPVISVKDINGKAITGLDDVKTFSLYTSASYSTATKLTTAPVAGTTYYSSITVDLWKENTYWLDYDHSAIKDNFSLTVPGYDVKFYALAEREMNSYIEIAFTLIPCKHDYEKVIVTKATTTKDGKYKNVCEICGYTASKQPTIYKASKVALSKTSYTYNGKVQKPSVTVKDSQGKTISTSHYTVSYPSGCKNAGTYKVTVKFKGNYSGTKTLTYKIKGIDVSKCKISLSKTSYTYNGKVQKPTVTVKSPSGTKLTTSSYTVTYASGRKNVGTYKVTIKMKGNYSGTKTLTFKILPTKTTLGTLTAAKKALTVKWTKKTTQVTGYQIQYSTTKSFKSYKTKNITSNKTTSTKLTGLSAKKTYYVRIRTYKTVNGTKIYSAWSTVKYKKTK